MKKRVGIALGLVLSVPAAAGDIYKWTDEQGQVHFGDRPPVGVQATHEEAGTVTANDTATGSGLRPAERARLSEIEKQESREAAEKRDREKAAAADAKRRERQTWQDARRCADYQQKINNYKRRLRAGCRASTCTSYNAQLTSYKRSAARVCH
jgi:Domain of unknown function (DUF4124)